MLQYNEDLSALILGTSANSFDEIDKAVTTLREKTGSNLPLLAEVENSYERLQNLQQQIAGLQQDKQQLLEQRNTAMPVRRGTRASRQSSRLTHCRARI